MAQALSKALDRIAGSSGPLPERARALLGALRPLVPFDAAWLAFAATGDPGWHRYDPDRRATMRFDADSRVVEDPRSWERALWKTLR